VYLYLLSGIGGETIRAVAWQDRQRPVAQGQTLPHGLRRFGFNRFDVYG
jgi:hypothetical protein